MAKRRLNKKKVFFVLMLFAGLIYGAYYLITTEKVRDDRFKTELIHINADEISSIVINNKNDNFEDVVLRKNDDNWVATKGAFTTKANPHKVNDMLSRFKSVYSSYIAARQEDLWQDYQVDEKEGSRIRFYKNKQLVDDFILSTSYSGQKSFIRLKDETEVYAVDAALTKKFPKGFDAFRNPQTLDINPDDIIQLVYQNPQDTIDWLLQKIDSNWLLKGSTADSLVITTAKMQSFLSPLKDLKGKLFVNDFDEVNTDDIFSRRLIIYTSETDSVKLNCYQYDNEEDYIIHSSQNQDAFFRSDSTGLFKPLFLDILALEKEELVDTK